MDRNKKVTVSTIPLSVHQVLYHCAVCLIVMLILVVLGGCSKRYNDYPTYLPFDISTDSDNGVGRFKSAHLVAQMDALYRGSNPGPIGVATFVNIDDLYTTSTFGRVYAEQVMSELAMRGFDVVELRHSEAMQFLGTNGEFALSRDAALVKQVRDLGGIVVGTYAVSPVRVYMNTRLIDPATSVVLAVGSVEMEKSKEITRMLRGGTFRASLERVPVKRFGFQNYPAMDWHANRNYGYTEEKPYLSNIRPTLPVPQLGTAPAPTH